MGFLQALFVAGAATFAIPVVIHLIFQTRKRPLVFSSLRFLRESLLRESRRLRLRDLILLLLRALACILIALSFARPYREGQLVGGAGGTPRTDLVLVLDDSPSLNAQEGSAPRWAGLLAKARGLCQERHAGDRVGVVLAGNPGRAEQELSGNFAAVEGCLKRERASPRRGDLAQALRTAVELLADSTAPVRRVTVLSDFQATQVDRGLWTEIAQRDAGGPRPVAVQLEAPGARAAGKLANLAVTDVRCKSDVWMEGRPVPFAARIENYGDGEFSNLAVRLVAGDKVLASRTVGLSPRSGAEIELAAAFPRPGEVSGRVEIAAHDALPDDDRRFFAARLRDAVKAVVIEDALRDTNTFLDQSYYLRMALDPRPRGGDILGPTAQPAESGGNVQAVTVAAHNLRPALFEDADLVFLVGVSVLSQETLAKLEEAVRGGRSLVIFLGRSEGAWPTALYEGLLWKGGEGLLPARPGPLFEGNLLAGKYDGLDAFMAGHPVFQPFSGELEAELRRPKFLRHYRADPADLKAGKRAPGSVLASFNDGSPLLLERGFGKGRVLLFTFCPRPEATDLPKRKVFVPLIHQVVRYLAGMESATKRNVLVGEPIVFAEAGIPPEATVKLEGPGPSKEPVQLPASESTTPEVVGIYTGSYQRGTLVEKVLWTANLDPRESDLSVEDLPALQTLFTSNLTEAAAQDAGVKLGAQSTDELKAQAPDWRYFLVAALLCLLLEVLVRDYWEG
jgi:hypothetical protein